ncbi:hypothetical protein SAMN04515674_11644 [Pseudarcicella hirudinis]|uniref:Cell division protein ZapB n=2 Tax=Pseudarcicella hirudinis TaxID=1079859 RepID=A0A1I5XYK2_9BACT|nr:hypothetical protein [Pseudarcicella hirudinis]SFQ36984.1 hypothetical protein SAMN04515674_11644 [Pseudarcicella hirudinis]
METNNNNQTFFKIALGVTFGIIALLAYLFVGARNETVELQKSLTMKVEQLSTTQIKLDSIDKVLTSKIEEIKVLGGNVTELEKVKEQLEADRKKLKSDFHFSAQKYDAKIKEYENFLAVKDEDIRKLKEENGQLTVRAKTLEDEKKVVEDENSSLKTEKVTLTQNLADYSAKNEELAKKVTLASAMKAQQVQVYALSENGKLRDGGRYKSSKIDKLKISFVLASNPVAEQNNKDIYVRIMDQNGAVISESANSGIMQFDGKELGYTTKQGIPFENNDQKVDIVYGKGSPYKSGKYSIELYSEGFKIGTGGFEVK